MEQKSDSDGSEINTPSFVIKALYSAISFPAGSQPDYDALSALFHPGAVIVPPASDTGGAIKLWTVSEFVEAYKPQFVEMRDTGFRESEIFKTESVFGNVAQYQSGYELEVGTRSLAFRGLNFFSLVRENNKWCIVSLVWDRAK